MTSSPPIRPYVALFLAAWLAGCGGGGGGNSNSPAVVPPPAGNFTDPTVYSSAANASLPSANEITAVTQHQVVVNGTTLAYTATAGHMTALRNNVPQASFFYVAYTLNGAAPATRPVTFFYNGGPGSASVWLHIGSFGPKRLDTGEPNMSGTPPFPLVDNAETLLDVSDLVFVDAVGSGYSQAIAPHTNSTFWGVDADAAVFRDFVMRYVVVNNRGSSPRFLYGESYGGPRAAVMADLLESAGMSVRGVVLQSPAMNYNSNCGIGGGISCYGYIPSYGATAQWFAFALPTPPAAQLPAFMQDMRAFAFNSYNPAAIAFITQGTPPADSILGVLEATTGLARPHWAGNINRGPEYYRTNLRPGTVYGRYDTRVTLPSNGGPGNAADPSSALISPSFGARIAEYLSGPLGFTTPSTYTVLGNAIQTWNFSHDGNALPDTIPDLASALAQNPNLKILAVNGYHDVATPFFTTERDLARLNHPNVRVLNYVGGHMTYLENASRRAMKADLAEFYGSALAN